MSHKYQPTYSTPSNFESVLRDLTREVLRNQPENIYEFAHDYFCKLSVGRSGPSEEVKSLSLGEQLDTFAEALQSRDSEQKGVLRIDRVRNTLQSLLQGILPEQVLYVMSQAQLDDDGNMEYGPFVDTVKKILPEIMKDSGFAKMVAEAGNVETIMGLDKSELEEEFSSILDRSQFSQSGCINVKFFLVELKNSELDLTKRQINCLLLEALENPNSKQDTISYADFIPQVHKILALSQVFEEYSQ